MRTFRATGGRPSERARYPSRSRSGARTGTAESRYVLPVVAALVRQLRRYCSHFSLLPCAAEALPRAA